MNGELNTTYEGLAVRFMRQHVNRGKDTSKQAEKKLKEFTTTGICPSCQGTRYNEEVLSSTFHGYSIYDLTSMQLDELVEVLLQINDTNAKPILDGIVERVKNLCDIGLGYLTLTRETTTLSGGESQRVKMVKYLSSN